MILRNLTVYQTALGLKKKGQVNIENTTDRQTEKVQNNASVAKADN